MTIPQPNTFEIILLSLLAWAWIWQFGYLLRKIRPVAASKDQTNKETTYPPVSVVISARNEAENLETFLPEILNQDYPDFQVVVVNDGSEDESDMVLARLKGKYENLYCTSIAPNKKFYHGKKLPLSLGIKAAKHEHLVLTDADCRPASDQWLKKMAAGLMLPGKELVLGIGNYEKTGGLTNLWIRYDTFTIAIQYLGYALGGHPYMGTGRNMSYTKSLFERTKGFKSHIFIASGDDDLFVQEASSPENTGVCISKEAHTISRPPESFKKWMHQKQRHLSTSGRYSLSSKIPLIIEPATRLLFWALTIYFIFFPNFVLIVLPFSLLLLIFKFTIWKLAANKTGMGKIFWGLAIFDIIQPFIIAYSHLGNLGGSKKRKWK
jgi:biofilm PGA synthesis N-glycosyltransferase PgaC